MGRFMGTASVAALIVSSTPAWAAEEANSTAASEQQPASSDGQGTDQAESSRRPIVVTGYRSERLKGDTQAGVLGTRSVLDTPFSVSTFSSTDIDNRMVISLSELLKDDPSVTPTYAGNSFQDGFTIRGFDAGVVSLGYYGLYGLVSGRQPFETLERVEVFKGPTGVLNGRAGNVGGSINLVPKTPAERTVNRVTAQYISKSNFELRGDVSRRLGENEQFGVRFSGAIRGGETAVNFVSSRIRTGTLSLDFRRPDFSINVIGDYSDGRYGAFPERMQLLATLPVVPRAPELTTLNTQPWTFRDIEQARIVGRQPTSSRFPVLTGTRKRIT